MNRRLVLACVSGILLAFTAGAYGQGNAPMTVDIAALAPNLEPEFTIWRTGQGAPAQWDIVADPTAAVAASSIAPKAKRNPPEPGLRTQFLLIR